MIAVILAGGKGRRMKCSYEKPLMKVGGVSLIDRVVRAVKSSLAERFFIATSSNTPMTSEHCRIMGYDIIHTLGKGFHEDVLELLKKHRAFVSIASDLPFLTADSINCIIKAYRGYSVTGVVELSVIPKGITPSYIFDFKGKQVSAIGLNIVTNSKRSDVLVLNDPLLGVNVNTLRELKVANKIARAKN